MRRISLSIVLAVLGVMVFMAGIRVEAVPVTSALDVVFSEAAWSGMPASSADEWIELHNTTGSAIDLTDWRLFTADTPNITLTGVIPAGGLETESKNLSKSDP